MSYIKDFFENEPLKAISFSILLMPFWYFSIFLLNHELYKKLDATLLIVMCFVISVSSCIILSVAYRLDDDKDDPKDIITIIGISSLVLWAWKIVLLFMVYSFYFLFQMHIYLYWYITIYFALLVLLLIISFLKSYKKLKFKY